MRMRGSDLVRTLAVQLPMAAVEAEQGTTSHRMPPTGPHGATRYWQVSSELSPSVMHVRQFGATVRTRDRSVR